MIAIPDDVVAAVLRRTAPVLSLLIVLAACGAQNTESGVYLGFIAGNAPIRIGEQAGIAVWSETGEELAWGNEDGVFTSAIGASEPRKLVARPVAGRPDWSPDGLRLAFVDPTAKSLVVVGARDGSVDFEVPLRNPEAKADAARLAIPTMGGPTWSPDGMRIAFLCWDGVSDQLCLIDSDGGRRRQITRIEGTDPGENRTGTVERSRSNTGPASWSVDGRYLAVALYAEVRGAASGVFAVDLVEGKSRRLSRLAPNSEIVWHSDGKSIFFSASQSGRSDVYRASLTGNGAESLTADLPEASRDPALSPDGSLLAVASGHEVVLMRIGGKRVGSIETGLRERYPTWSPDGTRLAFSAVEDPIAAYDP